MLVTSSRKIYNLEDRLQKQTVSTMIGNSFVSQKSEQTKLVLRHNPLLEVNQNTFVYPTFKCKIIFDVSDI